MKTTMIDPLGKFDTEEFEISIPGASGPAPSHERGVWILSGVVVFALILAAALVASAVAALRGGDNGVPKEQLQTQHIVDSASTEGSGSNIGDSRQQVIDNSNPNLINVQILEGLQIDVSGLMGTPEGKLLLFLIEQDVPQQLGISTPEFIEQLESDPGKLLQNAQELGEEARNSLKRIVDSELKIPKLAGPALESIKDTVSQLTGELWQLDPDVEAAVDDAVGLVDQLVEDRG